MERPRRAPTDVVRSRGIDHDDAAAVFARAAELDGERGVHDSPDDHLDDAELLAIGTGAGLSPESVRQALAELRSGAIGRGVATTGAGALAVPADESTWVGPRGVVVQRVVPVPVDGARRAAHRFLRGELFEKVRDHGGRSTWRPREGLAASVQRGLASINRKLDLHGTVTPVSVAVVPEPEAEGHRTLVRFEADLAPVRTQLGWGVASAGVVTAGVVGAAAAIPIGEAVVALLGLPAGGAAAGGGRVLSRGAYRRRQERVATALEAFLDRLEGEGGRTRW